MSSAPDAGARDARDARDTYAVACALYAGGPDAQLAAMSQSERAGFPTSGGGAVVTLSAESHGPDARLVLRANAPSGAPAMAHGVTAVRLVAPRRADAPTEPHSERDWSGARVTVGVGGLWLDRWHAQTSPPGQRAALRAGRDATDLLWCASEGRALPLLPTHGVQVSASGVPAGWFLEADVVPLAPRPEGDAWLMSHQQYTGIEVEPVGGDTEALTVNLLYNHPLTSVRLRVAPASVAARVTGVRLLADGAPIATLQRDGEAEDVWSLHGVPSGPHGWPADVGGAAGSGRTLNASGVGRLTLHLALARWEGLPTVPGSTVDAHLSAWVQSLQPLRIRGGVAGLPFTE
jgi:hypothetical protein